MEHRQLPKAQAHPHERLLARDEPVWNQQSRSEALLQAKLDVATSQMNVVSSQSRLTAQREMDAIHARVEQELSNVIRGTQGLRVIDPLALSPGKAQSVPASAPSKTKAKITSVRASGVVVNPQRSDRTAAATTTAAAATRLVSSTGTPATAANKPKAVASSRSARSATDALSPTHRTRTLSVDARASPSNYTFGFPTPFDESGFQSVIKWAAVSFEEARVAAVGPRVNLEALRESELPNRIVVSVACYLLNEVLSRDPSMQALWQQLKAPIFDAVFSPQLLSSHLARHQQRLAQRTEKASHEARADKPYDAVMTSMADEDGVLPPLPLRTATYQHIGDFSNYRLWVEENVGAQKDNQRLYDRVERLKGVVTNSRLVLLMAQRRVDTAKKRTILVAWRAYTERVKNQREVISNYVTEAHHRRVSETCFLRWRRLTVQNKLEEVREQFQTLSKKWQTMTDVHRHETNLLKEKIQDGEQARQTMAVRDAALRAQLNDSYAMESTALRTALTRKQTQCTQVLNHARRWERLAKTFRPVHVAPPVPKQLLTFAIHLRRFEDEFSVNAAATTTRVFRLVNVRASMTKFLLRWTNAVMGASPYKNMWVNVKRLATRRDCQTDAQLDPNALSLQEAVTASAASSSDPEAFSSYSLVYVVRELRRLIDRERKERCASAAMEAVLGAARNGAPSATAATAATNSSVTNKAKQWLSELQEQTKSDLTPSDSDGDEEVEKEAGGRDETLSLLSGGGPNDTSDEAMHRQLFAELCEVLYLFTEEGSRPSLLMHCPYLGSFFSAASLFASVPTHPTAMLWLLGTLFTGYVETFCGFENPYFRRQWPPYLRCGHEEALSRRPNPSLTTTEDPSEMGLLHGTLPTTTTTTTAAGIASVPQTVVNPSAAPAKGTYVLSRHTTIGKGPATSTAMAAGKGKRGKRAAGGSRLRRHDSMRDLGRALPHKSVRVTKMNELELVRYGVDREEDILAFIGKDDAQESFLHNMNGEEIDVEALMAGLEEGASQAGSPPPSRRAGPSSAPSRGPGGDAQADTSALTRRQQRRLQQQQQQQKQQQQQGDGEDMQRGVSDGRAASPPAMRIGFAGETILDSDDDEPEVGDGGRVASHRGNRPTLTRASSFYTELSAICQPRSSATRSRGGSAADMSGEDDDEDLTDLGLRDDMNYLRAVLRAQEKVEAEKATALLVSPKKNLFSAEELYLLFRLPAPSHAFDSRYVHVRQDLKPVASANTSRTDAVADWATHGDGATTAQPTTTAQRPSSSGAQSTATIPNTNIREPPTAISAFLTYTLLDADRRQIWQGMARVITSLITRLRVLDTATSKSAPAVTTSAKKSQAWKQRKSEVVSSRTGRSNSSRSLNSRSSSFVGIPEDDEAVTRGRVAKPVRHRGQARNGGGGDDDNNTRPALVEYEEPEEEAASARKPKAVGAVGASPSLTNTTRGASTSLPPILQSSTSLAGGRRAMDAASVPPTRDAAQDSTLLNTPSTAPQHDEQLGDALRQFNADTEAETGTAASEDGPPSSASRRTPHSTSVVKGSSARPASSGGGGGGGETEHGVRVRTQHSNAGHYASPPPIALGVPGDLRLAPAPLNVNGGGGGVAAALADGGTAKESTAGTEPRSGTRLSCAPSMEGRRGVPAASNVRQPTVPRTAPMSIPTQTLAPLIVHAETEEDQAREPREAHSAGTSRQPSLPPNSSKFRFEMKRSR